MVSKRRVNLVAQDKSHRVKSEIFRGTHGQFSATVIKKKECDYIRTAYRRKS